MQARSIRKPIKRIAPVTPAAVDQILASSQDFNTSWTTAYQAAEDKQAVDIRALDLRPVTTMADVFLICHGRNPKQNQAIADEIEKRMREEEGERPIAVEGLTAGEWILMDYGDLIVHIFSEKARGYYDLERLYRDARSLSLPSEKLATQ